MKKISWKNDEKIRFYFSIHSVCMSFKTAPIGIFNSLPKIIRTENKGESFSKITVKFCSFSAYVNSL